MIKIVNHQITEKSRPLKYRRTTIKDVKKIKDVKQIKDNNPKNKKKKQDNSNWVKCCTSS